MHHCHCQSSCGVCLLLAAAASSSWYRLLSLFLKEAPLQHLSLPPEMHRLNITSNYHLKPKTHLMLTLRPSMRTTSQLQRLLLGW